MGLVFVITGSLVAFLVLGGITFIADGNYVDKVASWVANCEQSMHIQNLDNSYWNLNTRCENWVLFNVFCVFLLFLVQPITLFNTFYMLYRVGRKEGYEVINNKDEGEGEGNKIIGG